MNTPAEPSTELAGVLTRLRDHAPGTADFDSALSRLTMAADRGEAQAQWHLGALYLQVSVLPDADANAAHWLERAAAQGVAPAVDRLADLHFAGRGVAQDDARAFSLHERLAHHGYAPAWCTLGYCYTQGLGAAADQARAVRCFLQGAALGFPPAYFGLGVRLALGAGAPEDRVFARALLQRAADGGYPHATETAARLPLNTGQRDQARQWHGVLKRNYDAAKPALQRLAESAQGGAEAAVLDKLIRELNAHFRRIQYGAIEDNGGRLGFAGAGGVNAQLTARPPAVEARCEHPRVLTARGFATLEECAHLMAQVHPRLRHMAEQTPEAALFGEREFFDGASATFRALQADAVVRNIERRAAALTGYPVAHLEPLSVVRYQGDQQYKTHVDYITPELLAEGRERGDTSGQRPVTFLLYLNTPAGGGTRYPRANLTVQGERGMAVIHHNTLPGGAIDEDSVHAGLPVERGEKWLLRCAVHENALV